MRCGHAPILALPLGQCPFMDTARKVADTPHSKTLPCAVHSDCTETQRLKYKYRGLAGGAAAANARSPRSSRRPHQCRPTAPTTGLNVGSAGGAASADGRPPRGLRPPQQRRLTKTQARLLDRQSLSSTETARPYSVNAYDMSDACLKNAAAPSDASSGAAKTAVRGAALRNAVGRPRPPPCARARRAGPPQRGHHGVACTSPTMTY
jgi:hypothetical protein